MESSAVTSNSSAAGDSYKIVSCQRSGETLQARVCARACVCVCARVFLRLHWFRCTRVYVHVCVRAQVICVGVHK